MALVELARMVFGDAAASMTAPLRFTSLVPVQLARLIEADAALELLRRFDRILVGGQAMPVDLLARSLPEPEGGLAAGILIGIRERVSREVADAFTTTGLSHVVAISGWNIALVGGVVGGLLAAAGVGRRSRSLLIVGALTTVTDTFARVSMHGVRESLLAAQLAAARLPS